LPRNYYTSDSLTTSAYPTIIFDSSLPKVFPKVTVYIKERCNTIKMPPKLAGPHKGPIELVSGDDLLPHGLGKRTRYAGAKGDSVTTKEFEALLNTLGKQAKNTTEEKDGDQDASTALNVDDGKMDNQVITMAKIGHPASKAPVRPKPKPKTRNSRAKKATIKSEEVVDEAGVTSNPKARGGRARKATPTTLEAPSGSTTVSLIQDPALTKILRKVSTPEAKAKGGDVKLEALDEKPKKTRAQTRKVSIKSEEKDVKDTDEDFEEEKAKKKQTSKRKAIDDGSEPAPKKQRVKKHPYGLTHGVTPYPSKIEPTPEQCKEVFLILRDLHSNGDHEKYIQPTAVQSRSDALSRAGCGDVPDLLDALLRTVLSAATTFNNANKAADGLTKVYGKRVQGAGKDSFNWEAVHKGSIETLQNAIRPGGLHMMKSKTIKHNLDLIYKDNCKRRDALLTEKETGEPADIIGIENMSQEQKDFELERFSVNMLTLDHILEMSKVEAIDEMTKLKGIGVKTAACVVLFCMNLPCIAVDTHVFRFCHWLGWVPEKANRDQTFSHGEVRIPDHLKFGLHQLFIKHGKECYRCRANTGPGTVEWDECLCPLEHLLTRTGKRKNMVIADKKFNVVGVKKAKVKKGKKVDDKSEG
jgi:endonuclease III